MAKENSRINIIALTATLGIIWGCGVFVLGLMATYLNWGNSLVTAISSLYLGYNTTLIGSLIGGIWALIDGASAGAVIAFVYNYISKIAK